MSETSESDEDRVSTAKSPPVKAPAKKEESMIIEHHEAWVVVNRLRDEMWIATKEEMVVLTHNKCTQNAGVPGHYTIPGHQSRA